MQTGNLTNWYLLKLVSSQTGIVSNWYLLKQGACEEVVHWHQPEQRPRVQGKSHLLVPATTSRGLLLPRFLGRRALPVCMRAHEELGRDAAARELVDTIDAALAGDRVGLVERMLHVREMPAEALARLDIHAFVEVAPSHF